MVNALNDSLKWEMTEVGTIEVFDLLKWLAYWTALLAVKSWSLKWLNYFNPWQIEVTGCSKVRVFDLIAGWQTKLASSDNIYLRHSFNLSFLFFKFRCKNPWFEILGHAKYGSCSCYVCRRNTVGDCQAEFEFIYAKTVVKQGSLKLFNY